MAKGLEALYDRDLVKKNSEIVEKEKSQMPFYYSLQSHQQNFLELIVFDGKDLMIAYNTAYVEHGGFELLKRPNKAISAFKKANMQHAFTELTLLRKKLMVSKMGGYIETALDKIVYLIEKADEERTQLDASKFMVGTYLKNFKEIIEDTQGQGISVHVDSRNGGNVSVINIIASDISEQKRVFDGNTAEEIMKKINDEQSVIIEHVDSVKKEEE